MQCMQSLLNKNWCETTTSSFTVVLYQVNYIYLIFNLNLPLIGFAVYH